MADHWWILIYEEIPLGNIRDCNCIAAHQIIFFFVVVENWDI